MAHMVKCSICEKMFDRDKIQAVKSNGRRYAHYTCLPEGEVVPLPEAATADPDLIKLKKYITNLFGTEARWAMINKQIKKYINEDGYTYSGILKSLIYFFEVKHNPIDKANGALGIVPYVYQDARNYYYNLFLINQANNNLTIEPKEEKEKIVIIKTPKIIKRIKLFTFLEEEEN